MRIVLCVSWICILLLFFFSASADIIAPDKTISMNELKEVIEQYINKHPDSVEGYLNMANLYCTVYGCGRQRFNIYYTKDKEGVINQDVLPRFLFAPYTFFPTKFSRTGDIAVKRLPYLIKAIHYYDIASQKNDMDPKRFPHCIMGILLEEASYYTAQLEWPYSDSSFDKEVLEKGKNSSFWEEQALTQYQQCLEEEKKSLSPDRPLSESIIVESSAKGIVRIMGKRTDLNTEQQKYLRRIKRLASQTKECIRMIPPEFY